MESISHRELRNESGRILKAVAAGESFTITNNGEPVAMLVPLGTPHPGLPVSRPRRRKGGFSELPLYESDETVQEIIDDLRGDR
jgi:prevent-host-death family protein